MRREGGVEHNCFVPQRPAPRAMFYVIRNHPIQKRKKGISFRRVLDHLSFTDGGVSQCNIIITLDDDDVDDEGHQSRGALQGRPGTWVHEELYLGTRGTVHGVHKEQRECTHRVIHLPATLKADHLEKYHWPCISDFIEAGNSRLLIWDSLNLMENWWWPLIFSLELPFWLVWDYQWVSQSRGSTTCVDIDLKYKIQIQNTKYKNTKIQKSKFKCKQPFRLVWDYQPKQRLDHK